LPEEFLMKDATAPRESLTLPPDGEAKIRLTLLVVDDDAAWRDALKEWLEREGFRTIMLARGDWVVHAVNLHQPDVVVLDVNLPGANGLEVLAAVERRWPGLPVVVMTAFGGPAIGADARRLGAAEYLEKPFRIATLVDAIRRAAGNTGSDPRRAQA
jgi:DNA-binding NtrC family response regulator